jgi:hypothetical protein
VYVNISNTRINPAPISTKIKFSGNFYWLVLALHILHHLLTSIHSVPILHQCSGRFQSQIRFSQLKCKHLLKAVFATLVATYDCYICNAIPSPYPMHISKYVRKKCATVDQLHLCDYYLILFLCEPASVSRPATSCDIRTRVITSRIAGHGKSEPSLTYFSISGSLQLHPCDI